MEKGTELALERKADKNNYNDSELISIKTTLHLPYYTGSNTYERVYGSVTINGVDYEYVKRRVYNDTLELLCLPNHAKTNLKKAGNAIAKATADAEPSGSKKNGIAKKISLPQFCNSLQAMTAFNSRKLKPCYYNFNSNFCLNGFTKQPERPPQSMQVSS